MISRKNCFTILVMVLVIFILFMFTGGAKQVLSDYDTNEYLPELLEVDDTPAVSEELKDGAVCYLGDHEGVYNRLKEWCIYNKRGLQRVSHGAAFEAPEAELSMVVIDGASLQEGDIAYLYSARDAGVTMLFATVPDNAFLNAHTDIPEMMGIRAVQNENVELKGMRLYGGFLLGGGTSYELYEKAPEYYQDLNLTIPWFILEAASKVYMSGVPDEKDHKVDSSYEPPVIWRYNTKSNLVYTVNSNFMEQLSAIGIYTAVESTSKSVAVYPVINSQNLVFSHFPSLTNENEEQIRELYSRDTVNFMENLVWSTVNAVITSNKLIPSFMISAKVDYGEKQEPSEKALHYLMELIRESHGEAGLNTESVNGASAGAKLAYDKTFLSKELPDYHSYNCYIGNTEFETAKNILDTNGCNEVSLYLTEKTPETPLITARENKLLLTDTTSGQYYSFQQDMNMKSVETALGYSVTVQDMRGLLYPDSEEDYLQNFMEDYASTVDTLYRGMKGFDATSLTEAGNRIRSYLNLEYKAEVSPEKERITLTTNIMGQEQYFIVRTADREVTGVKPGTYAKLEEGVYLIKTSSSSTEIELSEKKSSFFSEEKNKQEDER